MIDYDGESRKNNLTSVRNARRANPSFTDDLHMNSSNPYAPSALTPTDPIRVRVRDQRLLRQALLFSLFYFVGFGFLICANAGFAAVPRMFSDVIEDFFGVWLPELIFALIPYVAIRAVTIGRFVRPTWWSFCLAGVVTFPFLNFYANALIRQWDTPMMYNVFAHLLSVASAILIELTALASFGGLFGERGDAEPRHPPKPGLRLR